MNEEALREMVRAALARRMATPAHASSDEPLPVRMHMSHARYVLPDSGGACLIEPAVTCNHCGYCQSHGH
jgi:predicted Zn-ribbon and HTH transcriptional regulator